jgi:hypothetical protein
MNGIEVWPSYDHDDPQFYLWDALVALECLKDRKILSERAEAEVQAVIDIMEKDRLAHRLRAALAPAPAPSGPEPEER